MRNPFIVALAVIAVALTAFVTFRTLGARDGGEPRVEPTLAGPPGTSRERPTSAAPGSDLPTAGTDDADGPPSDDARSYDLMPERERTMFGVTTVSGPYDLEEVRQFADAVEEWPQALLFAQDWANTEFDAERFRRVAALEMLPIVGWEPWDYTAEPDLESQRGTQPRFRLQRIVDGEFDGYIREWAEGIAELEFHVGMRFAHEMNGWWYPWGGEANQNEPEDYVAAWRHVHGIFEEAGADNVVWIWSPNRIYEGSTPLTELWPGDEYVDWLGMSGYAGDLGGSDARTFAEIYGPTLEQLRDISEAPILLTEIAIAQGAGDQAEWITAFVQEVQGADEVIGFIYFEVDTEEADWRISVVEDARRAFARALNWEGVGRPDDYEPPGAIGPG